MDDLVIQYPLPKVFIIGNEVILAHDKAAIRPVGFGHDEHSVLALVFHVIKDERIRVIGFWLVGRYQ